MEPKPYISRETTADVIRRFGDLGLQVHVTEIDVNLCADDEPSPCEETPEKIAK